MGGADLENVQKIVYVFGTNPYALCSLLIEKSGFTLFYVETRYRDIVVSLLTTNSIMHFLLFFYFTSDGKSAWHLVICGNNCL